MEDSVSWLADKLGFEYTESIDDGKKEEVKEAFYELADEIDYAPTIKF